MALCFSRHLLPVLFSGSGSLEILSTANLHHNTFPSLGIMDPVARRILSETGTVGHQIRDVGLFVDSHNEPVEYRRVLSMPSR